jgi:hypothetical protein
MHVFFFRAQMLWANLFLPLEIFQENRSLKQHLLKRANGNLRSTQLQRCLKSAVYKMPSRKWLCSQAMPISRACTDIFRNVTRRFVEITVSSAIESGAISTRERCDLVKRATRSREHGRTPIQILLIVRSGEELPCQLETLVESSNTKSHAYLTKKTRKKLKKTRQKIE